jgi:hypothetical protein
VEYYHGQHELPLVMGGMQLTTANIGLPVSLKPTSNFHESILMLVVTGWAGWLLIFKVPTDSCYRQQPNSNKAQSRHKALGHPAH